MKALKVLATIAAAIVALALILYLEEDLRGWLAWHKCKHEFAAKGTVFDWNAYIPPPVPDDQNFFAAPKMQAWFVKNINSTSDLPERLANPKTSSIGTTNAIISEADARDYLAWSDQFAPDFNLIRDALKRPYARMNGNYRDPVTMPIPNFVAVRIVAQTLAQRAHCHFLLNQPEPALDDLTLMHDFCRLLEAGPTGKPMTLVAAMINVAVAGLYVDTIAEGFRQRAWREPQLATLQKQLADVNLTPLVWTALQEEPVALCRTCETIAPPKFFPMSRSQVNWFELMPRGWIYQNMVNIAKLELEPLDGFDSAHDTISPHVFNDAARNMNKFFKHNSPYKFLAAIAIPNFSKAWQTTAHNQTMVNEAQIACALERYRLTHGEYPQTLDGLTPQFIEKIPHDLIVGDSLQYRPTADGKFLLYSVGWNERDDGGKDSPPSTNGGVNYATGDWVWKN